MSNLIPGNQKHLSLEDRKYHETLVNARTGIAMTKHELHQLDNVVTPLIENGQSPYEIICGHPELDISVRTLYTYIDKGILCSRNGDLKRKVRFKARKCHKTQINDRGIEFGNPDALETGNDGIMRTSIYYCDPMRSGQKGGIEQAHTMLREVLPKGTDFGFLTQRPVFHTRL